MPLYNRWVYLGLGSNVGNRKKNIRLAVVYLSKRVTVIKASKFYESKPWGYKGQKNFCNVVLKTDCDLNPIDLLKFVKSIEKKLGRIKKFKWGPRTIDIDIIAHKNTILNREKLTLPHKYAHRRLFVVKPLVELEAGLKLNGIELRLLQQRLEGKDSLETC